MPESIPDGESRSPEELFVHWLLSRESGEALDFDALCREHPAASASLRRLREAAVNLENQVPSRDDTALPGIGGLFAAWLAKTHGAGCDPKVDLVDDAEHPNPVAKRLDRLEEQSPAGPRYEIQEEIGRGGMGSVLRVFDSDLRRTLAMKVMRPDDSSEREATSHDPEKVARFIEEAQITGQLDHPGVVPVHELAVDTEGQVYFTMRLVRGRDLREIFKALHEGHEGWNLPRALGVLLKVCEVMSFAHDKGVIHRDLKPANIMVGRYGEVYVVDWGLARVDGREDTHDLRLQSSSISRLSTVQTDRRDARDSDLDSPIITMDGTVVGTPFYMPPEQAGGRIDEVGTRADIYSVGAMLYHLLTGRMPYHTPGTRPSPHTVLAMVLQGPPQPVREVAPEVPEPLADICRRALERDPRLRYSSMRELAEDLRAYLEGRIESRRASIFEVVRLSMSLVLLYVGVLIVAMGPAILLTLTWDSTPNAGRLLLAALPALLLGVSGSLLWRRGQLKTALPILLGCALVVPSLAFVLLHQLPGLSQVVDEEGKVYEATLMGFAPLGEIGPHDRALALLDVKLFWVSLVALLSGIVLLWQTRSHAFLWYVSIVGTACWYFAGIQLGWRDLEVQLQAASFLPWAVLLLCAGFGLEVRGRSMAGRALYVIGFVVLSSSWFTLAGEGYPVLYLGEPSHGEEVQLSFMVGGLIALVIAYVAQRLDTPTLARYSAVPYLLAPACVLLSMSVLVSAEITRYEVLLPVACLIFITISVLVQRKNLLYAGAGYLSVAVFQITDNHFRDEWSLPLTLMLSGATLGVIALVSRQIAERAQARTAES